MQKPKSDWVTVPNALALGGPKEFTGRTFILATLKTVQKPEFWQLHGKNIGLVVNCIGKRGGAGGTDLLPDAAGRPLQVFIDVRKFDSLPIALNTASQLAKGTFQRGSDILVHCRLTFHRGPAICVGMYQDLCGVHYQVEGC